MRLRRRPTAQPHLRLDYARHEIVLDATSAKRRRSVAKEPYTVAWLEQTLRPGDVLYDIGANVGAYSLVAAAVQPTASVFAFEPGFESYAALCRNIVLNGMGDRITALPVALGARSELVDFQYQRLAPGNAQHHIGPGAPFEPEFTQRLIGVRLDDLRGIVGLPAATHVKLDVDGAELQVLEGAAAILAAPELREIQVEVEPGDEQVVQALARHGFEVAARHQTPQVENVRLTRPHQSLTSPR